MEAKLKEASKHYKVSAPASDASMKELENLVSEKMGDKPARIPPFLRALWSVAETWEHGNGLKIFSCKDAIDKLTEVMDGEVLEDWLEGLGDDAENSCFGGLCDMCALVTQCTCMIFVCH